jgi:hypothetical protein
VSDENGIGNRYAGFFTTKKAGLDTLVIIADQILHNPSAKEVDSTLRTYKKTDVDSIAVVSISSDSVYSFPLSNYPSTLAETRIAGDNNQVSEVTRQSDDKVLYKLKIDDNTLRRRNVSAQPTEYMKKLMGEYKDTVAAKKAMAAAKENDDFFQTEFEKAQKSDTAKKDNNAAGKEINAPALKYDVLKTIKKFRYKPPKFSVDYGSAGFNSGVLINRYQAYGGGAGPIMLNSGTPLNGLIRLGTSELLEDVKITGGFKISTNLKDNEWLMSYQNYKRRLDWGLTYYRNVQQVGDANGNLIGKLFTNLYQVNVSYPFDVTKSIRLTTGIRSDKIVFTPRFPNDITLLKEPDDKTLYSTTKLEYVYDNSLNPAMNIWNGMRYKIYFDYNRQINKVKFANGPSTFNLGFDARYYYPIYRNLIWAGRVAGDFSWGNQKLIYYLGGVDGWLMFGDNNKNGSDRFFNTNNPPANDQNYAFQSLAVNMRGFIQNVANGNNALVINSEFRVPIVSTFFNRTINNSFLNNFQITQFIDLGTAWNGVYSKIKRPEMVYGQYPQAVVKVKAGGIGPFAGGYGFGARSTLLGYFVKYDVAWPMNVFFRGKPVMYVSLGLDF